MFFTQYEFLLFFLPAAWFGFRLLREKLGQRAATYWLLACSLVFYAAWRPAGVLVLALSIAVNYLIAGRMRAVQGSARRTLLIAGIVLDFSVLAAFKYGGSWTIPLGISFFTFVQIAYLIEVYRGEAFESDLANYALLVSFFPKITAGPIVQPSDFLAQISKPGKRPNDFVEGVALFLLGMAKKLLFADMIAAWAVPVFAAAKGPSPVGFVDAWGGVLAYTLQIYFDFSGYSDMAIGLGRIFGFKLPVNFNSPYKAQSMIEFWRRWHITLTRFLTENIFFKLPGHRKSVWRRHLNLMITMVICGVWHGAGWTFALWGALHGAFLIANHLWRGFREKRALAWRVPGLAWAATMLAVVCGWALFGAANGHAAWNLLRGMAGANGFAIAVFTGENGWKGFAAIAILMAVAAIGPNTQELLAQTRDALTSFRAWIAARNRYWFVPGMVTLWIFGVMLFLAQSTQVNPFIYAVF